MSFSQGCQPEIFKKWSPCKQVFYPIVFLSYHRSLIPQTGALVIIFFSPKLKPSSIVVVWKLLRDKQQAVMSELKTVSVEDFERCL